MKPRILIIQTFYPEFLKDVYAANPCLNELSFEEQNARLFDSAFGTGDAYSHGLRLIGCEATEVVCNADHAQAKWAEHRGLSSCENIHERRRRIVAAQIEALCPEVLYVFEWCPLGDEFIRWAGTQVPLVVGEIASPLPIDRTYRGYDLMISSWPPFVDHFRRQGMAAEHVRLGFDRRILKRLDDEPPRYPVTFVGGFAPSHPDRISWLESLLQEVDIDIFCYGLERTRPDSPIRSHYRGQVWGWEMYRTLRRSRITLNRHARLEVDGVANTEWCNNMRMYEATGVGTCLLTEWRPHLHELFEPDREVLTYRDDRECIEKIEYFLSHEEERATVARAGQLRTLQEHLYTQRMEELLDIFVGRLRARRRDSLAHHRDSKSSEHVPA